MTRGDFRNACDDDGTPLCPSCGARIEPGDPTLFASDYMLHVDCWLPPEETEDEAPDPEPA